MTREWLQPPIGHGCLTIIHMLLIHLHCLNNPLINDLVHPFVYKPLHHVIYLILMNLWSGGRDNDGWPRIESRWRRAKNITLTLFLPTDGHNEDPILVDLRWQVAWESLNRLRSSCNHLNYPILKFKYCKSKYKNIYLQEVWRIK